MVQALMIHCCGAGIPAPLRFLSLVGSRASAPTRRLGASCFAGGLLGGGKALYWKAQE